MSKSLSVLLAACCWASSVAAPPAAAQAPAAPSVAADAANQADPKVVARGRAVFLENCVACHGQDATGGADANTDLTRSLVVRNDVDGKQFAQFLADGRPEQRMPGFALEPDRVKDLAVYLHAISVLKDKQP